MRNPKRIKEILTIIEREWSKNPDWRFNQLLINLGIIPDGRHWNIEDDLILKVLNKKNEEPKTDSKERKEKQ